MHKWRFRLFVALLCFCVCHLVTSAQSAQSLFRVERQPVSSKAELVTIFGTLASTHEDIPLLSALVETMGDEDPSNDRLRYVWSLTYTKPTFAQRAAATVPFFYKRVGGKEAERVTASGRIPPPIFDFQASRWRTVARGLWTLAQYTVIDDQGFIYRAAPRAYERNAADHKQSHLLRALAILYLLESDNNYRPAIPKAQINELQTRLALAASLMGHVIKRDSYSQIASKQRSQWEQTRGHNWEMLRQRAEAEGLYFEPLTLPDGTATHAMLWISRQDLQRSSHKDFNKRFLNISNPYSDARLHNWKGYTETSWLDSNNRRLARQTEGAQKIELIPLAVYGLNHPRVPILLVDFRNELNPKGRELSRRLLYDITRNALRISPFRTMYWWTARKAFDVVMRRHGADITQPSRLRASAELNLLLMLSDSINPQLRSEITRHVLTLGANPMENSLKADIALARANYEALLKGLREQK